MFTPMLKELPRAVPGLESNLRRGSGSEIAEFLKSGTAELAIAALLMKPGRDLMSYRCLMNLLVSSSTEDTD
jgi:hypothetical protein